MCVCVRKRRKRKRERERESIPARRRDRLPAELGQFVAEDRNTGTTPALLLLQRAILCYIKTKNHADTQYAPRYHPNSPPSSFTLLSSHAPGYEPFGGSTTGRQMVRSNRWGGPET